MEDKVQVEKNGQTSLQKFWQGFLSKHTWNWDFTRDNLILSVSRIYFQYPWIMLPLLKGDAFTIIFTGAIVLSQNVRICHLRFTQQFPGYVHMCSISPDSQWNI